MVYLIESLVAEVMVTVSSFGAGPLIFDFETFSLNVPAHGSVAACVFFWLNAMAQLNKRTATTNRFTGPPYGWTNSIPAKIDASKRARGRSRDGRGGCGPPLSQAVFVDSAK